MSRELDEHPRLTVPVSPERDHLRGPTAAPVTLLEYGDFECPHCGQAHLVLEKLLPRFGDSVCFVFRHFPLAKIHPRAHRAAEAAEAAGAQGRFWEMHDTLFENQQALEDDDLLTYARDLGLDVQRFELGLSRGDYADRVREDFVSGVRSGVNGTPTFFINGERHDAPWDPETLGAAIEMRIEHAAAPRRSRGRRAR